MTDNQGGIFSEGERDHILRAMAGYLAAQCRRCEGAGAELVNPIDPMSRFGPFTTVPCPACVSLRALAARDASPVLSFRLEQRDSLVPFDGRDKCPVEGG